MATTPAFEWLCDQVEAETAIDRLAARGTVRIALKQGGLEAASAEPDQIAVVLSRVLPPELSGRGVEDAEGLCRRLTARLQEIPDCPGTPDSPEAVFARLGS